MKIPAVPWPVASAAIPSAGVLIPRKHTLALATTSPEAAPAIHSHGWTTPRTHKFLVCTPLAPPNSVYLQLNSSHCAQSPGLQGPVVTIEFPCWSLPEAKGTPKEGLRRRKRSTCLVGGLLPPL
jgi:hypothetical protein